MYQDSKRTGAAIVLLIKHFVWWHSPSPSVAVRRRCRRRRGLLKLPIKFTSRVSEKFLALEHNTKRFSYNFTTYFENYY